MSSTTTSAASIHPGHIERHLQQLQEAANDIVSKPATTSRTMTTLPQKDQLVFSFCIDLPEDIPPTLTASSCRYFYSVVVSAKLKLHSTEGHYHADGAEIVVHAPLTILLTALSLLSLSSLRVGVSATEDPTRRQSHNEQVKGGTCMAMAHLAGLLCHVSATKIHLQRHAGTMTVQRQSRHHHSSSGHHAAAALANNIPTLHVADSMGKVVVDIPNDDKEVMESRNNDKPT